MFYSDWLLKRAETLTATVTAGVENSPIFNLFSNYIIKSHKRQLYLIARFRSLIYLDKHQRQKNPILLIDILLGL